MGFLAEEEEYRPTVKDMAILSCDKIGRYDLSVRLANVPPEECVICLGFSIVQLERFLTNKGY